MEPLTQAVATRIRARHALERLNPRATRRAGQGSWLDFVEAMGEDPPDQAGAMRHGSAGSPRLPFRLEAHRTDPDAAIPWESLRQELMQG